MSSCYVYLSCTVEGCEAQDSIYTGDEFLDHFKQRNFDPIEVKTPCDFHNTNWDAVAKDSPND